MSFDATLPWSRSSRSFSLPFIPIATSLLPSHHSHSNGRVKSPPPSISHHVNPADKCKLYLGTTSKITEMDVCSILTRLNVSLRTVKSIATEPSSSTPGAFSTFIEFHSRSLAITALQRARNARRCPVPKELFILRSVCFAKKKVPGEEKSEECNVRWLEDDALSMDDWWESFEHFDYGLGTSYAESDEEDLYGVWNDETSSESKKVSSTSKGKGKGTDSGKKKGASKEEENSNKIKATAKLENFKSLPETTTLFFTSETLSSIHQSTSPTSRSKTTSLTPDSLSPTSPRSPNNNHNHHNNHNNHNNTPKVTSPPPNSDSTSIIISSLDSPCEPRTLSPSIDGNNLFNNSMILSSSDGCTTQALDNNNKANSLSSISPSLQSSSNKVSPPPVTTMLSHSRPSTPTQSINDKPGNPNSPTSTPTTIQPSNSSERIYRLFPSPPTPPVTSPPSTLHPRLPLSSPTPRTTNALTQPMMVRAPKCDRENNKGRRQDDKDREMNGLKTELESCQKLVLVLSQRVAMLDGTLQGLEELPLTTLTDLEGIHIQSLVRLSLAKQTAYEKNISAFQKDKDRKLSRSSFIIQG